MTKFAIILIFAYVAKFASACRHINHIYSAIDSSYIKSACTLEIESSYQDAERLCRQLNMELFIIDDQEVYDELSEAFEHSFAGKMGWINGRKDSAGVWSAWDKSSTKKAAEAAPLVSTLTSILLDLDEMNCLSWDDSAGYFEGNAKACDEKLSHFTCERMIEPDVNLDACFFTDIITDSNNMPTPMSSCLIATLSNYWEAEQYCLNKGMTLLTGFHDFGAGYNSDADFWVNGEKTGGVWKSYSPKEKTVDTSVATNWAAGGQSSGLCLSMTQQAPGDWVGKGADCLSAKMYLVCEYFDV